MPREVNHEGEVIGVIPTAGELAEKLARKDLVQAMKQLREQAVLSRVQVIEAGRALHLIERNSDAADEFEKMPPEHQALYL